VVEQVGEGLVDLIEEGKMHSPEMTGLLEKYVRPMLDKNIDFLVLGCTHYPFLTPQLERIVGDKVRVLDSGEAIARQTRVILEQENLINNSGEKAWRKFYTNKNTQVLQDMLDALGEPYKAEKRDF
jgi:glutamate racemase